MLSSILNEQANVDIHLDERAVYLRPTPLTESSPSNDHLLSGVVVLTLLAPKRVKSIIVRLVGKYDLSFAKAGLYESGKTYESEVSIINSTEEDRLFEKGMHSFAFTFIVPSSSAPYERSKHGRIYHRLSAVVQGPGLLGFRATAERDVWITVHLAGENEVNEHHLRVEGFHEDIGPYAITTGSQNLTVGGLLSYHLSLPRPPRSLELYSATASLITTYTLTSPSRPTDPPERTTQQRQIFFLDSNNAPHSHQSIVSSTPQGFKSLPGLHLPARPLSELRGGEPYHLSHLVRLPNDNHIRPSTMPGTRTPLRVSHELLLELHYSTPAVIPVNSAPSKPETSILKVVRPITISSCCCMIESFLLPSYSDAVNSPAYPNGPGHSGPCVCKSSTEELVKKHLFSLDTSAQPMRGVGIKAEYGPMLPA